MASCCFRSFVVVLLTSFTLQCLPVWPMHIEFEKTTMDDYLKQRHLLIAKDAKNRTGQNIVLTDSEKKANDILMSFKRKELLSDFASQQTLSAQSFITAKPKIEKSNVFKIIQKMPKGAVLHLHDLSMASYSWLVKNISQSEICYMCFNSDKKVVEFKFSLTQPAPVENCEWISVPLARQKSGNPEKFDAELFANLTMTSGDPRDLYPTQKEIWEKFGGIFVSLSGLLGYEKMFADYYEQGLKEHLEDNVQYTEIRALLIPVYDLYGNTNTDPENTLLIYKNVTDQFIAKHPDFFGSKVIYIAPRVESQSAVGTAVTKAEYLFKKYPEFMSGFDLVGQEDPGNTLLYYAKELLMPKNSGIDLPYFFHAGETNWEGQEVDYNLADALLLGTKRVGHGFGFVKHPELMKEAKQKGISAEVCPISNQVLGLVADMRNHPASTFLSEDFPMTVNSDDPAIWGATGLSYDFYEMFMGMTRMDDDLRLLKQLAINSIKYCSLNPTRKQQLMDLWTSKWDIFIQTVINDFSPLV